MNTRVLWNHTFDYSIILSLAKCTILTTFLLWLSAGSSLQCYPSSAISVCQSKPRPLGRSAIFQWSVTVSSGNISPKCFETNITLSCPFLDSTEALDYSIIHWEKGKCFIKQNIGDDCSLTFKYSWDNQLNITPFSSQQCCC